MKAQEYLSVIERRFQQLPLRVVDFVGVPAIGSLGGAARRVVNFSRA
jgi:hypothetical protein